MKDIVVLDGKTLGDVDYSMLNKFGNVIYYDSTESFEVADRIKDAEIVITNKVVLGESELSCAKKLKLICESATGYNNIDINYAKDNNIAVFNVAGYSTKTVAQHTFAMLLSLFDNIAYFDDYVKNKEYSSSKNFTNLVRPYDDIDGKVWGIVGLGAIGREVAKIAEAFGAKVVYYSTTGNNNNPEYERVTLEKLLTESDIISIHAPLNDNTKSLFNYKNICKMKKSAILINVGRDPIVVEEDLARAIDEEIISGACLDVFCIEPVLEDNPLLSIKHKDRIILTPHIAWASRQARHRLFSDLVDNIESFYSGEKKNKIC